MIVIYGRVIEEPFAMYLFAVHMPGVSSKR